MHNEVRLLQKEGMLSLTPKKWGLAFSFKKKRAVEVKREFSVLLFS